MKRSPAKKPSRLSLSSETLARLQDAELSQVRGGYHWTDYEELCNPTRGCAASDPPRCYA